MFAKELRRGKSLTSTSTLSQAESPTIQTDSKEREKEYCFDGEKLILNYLTYQYIDLTYHPLQEIVNYPEGIRSSSIVTTSAYSSFLILSLGQGRLVSRWYYEKASRLNETSLV